MSKRRRTSMDSLRVDNANLRRELEVAEWRRDSVD